MCDSIRPDGPQIKMVKVETEIGARVKLLHADVIDVAFGVEMKGYIRVRHQRPIVPLCYERVVLKMPQPTF